MKTFKTLTIVLCLCIAWGLNTRAAEEIYTIKSPDKKLSVNFILSSEKKAFYEVIYKNAMVLERSKLGLVRKDEDFSQQLSLLSDSKSKRIKQDYEMLTAKRRQNTYTANHRVFELRNENGEVIHIIFQVSNDGVALRYYFPGQSQDIKYIEEEQTTFHLPGEAKAFMQTMANAKEGWAEVAPSYEDDYLQHIPVGTPSPKKAGWAFPALFEVGTNWVLLTESAAYGDYCAGKLHQFAEGGEYRLVFPDPREVFPGGGANPESALPWYTPWRIIAVGSLKTIAESTLGTDLAKPAVPVDWSFIKPGKASWSWGLLKDDATNFDVQKQFIDHAADMNWQYCLIDADWDKKIGYDKIKELVDYGHSKNVSIILWYNSSGTWNSTQYSPKGALIEREARRKEFQRIQFMGIKGVKIDFFGGDGQSMITYYKDILEDALEFKLLVNFHGCTLPRGWQRTYPNLMTAEAIKGFEFITFDQHHADVAATHCAMIPFTRNVFDPMDFTPGSFYKIPNIKRKTTEAFELALSVLFTSGIQHFPETPEGMSHVPAYVKEYLRNLPDVWDDTKFITGYPGKLVVMARRAGSTWYIAGINGENSIKPIELDLSFFKNKKGNLISDQESDGKFTQRSLTIQKDGRLKLVLQANGGFVIKLN